MELVAHLSRTHREDRRLALGRHLQRLELLAQGDGPEVHEDELTGGVLQRFFLGTHDDVGYELVPPYDEHDPVPTPPDEQVPEHRAVCPRSDAGYRYRRHIQGERT